MSDLSPLCAQKRTFTSAHIITKTEQPARRVAWLTVSRAVAHNTYSTMKD